MYAAKPSALMIPMKCSLSQDVLLCIIASLARLLNIVILGIDLPALVRFVNRVVVVGIPQFVVEVLIECWCRSLLGRLISGIVEIHAAKAEVSPEALRESASANQAKNSLTHVVTISDEGQDQVLKWLGQLSLGGSLLSLPNHENGGSELADWLCQTLWLWIVE